MKGIDFFAKEMKLEYDKYSNDVLFRDWNPQPALLYSTASCPTRLQLSNISAPACHVKTYAIFQNVSFSMRVQAAYSNILTIEICRFIWKVPRMLKQCIKKKVNLSPFTKLLCRGTFIMYRSLFVHGGGCLFVVTS